MDTYALHYAYLNTCSWDWMVYKVVGEASGIFNDIAVFVGVLHTTLSLEVSLQWTAHLQKPVGISLLKERNGLFLDRLASSMMDGTHLPCSLACRDIVSAWAVAACLRLMPCVWGVAHPETCSATPYCCWQPAGVFVSPPSAEQTSQRCLRALVHSSWQGGKPADTLVFCDDWPRQ